jgi:DegV family protein with EDD domain
MDDIRVITDSTSSIGEDLIKKYKVIQVSFYFEIDGNLYKDLYDIKTEEIFEKLKNKNFIEFKAFPPRPEDFLNEFKRVEENKIFCITISSTLSGCYKNALIAKTMIKDKEIEVIDSLNAGSGEGILTYKILNLIENGYSFKEIKIESENLINKIRTYVYIDSLKDVYRTGRIPKIISNFGSLLSLKPIVSIDYGKIRSITLAKNRVDGINKLIEIIKREIKEETIFCMYINFSEEIEFFREEILKIFPNLKIYFVNFTPIMGYAVLTGAFGVSFLGGERI